MMKFIKNYLDGLRKHITRKDLLRVIEQLRSNLLDYVIPAYEAGNKTLGNHRFSSKWMMDLDRDFGRRVKSRFKGNVLVVTENIMKRCLENITVLQGFIERNMAADIFRDSLTFNSASLIRYTESIDFAARYSQLLLNHAFSLETQLMRENSMVDKGLSNTQVRWLETNRDKFMDIMAMLDVGNKELANRLEDIPDVDVKDGDVAQAAVGMRKLDPEGLLSYKGIISPIYHVRLAWEDWLFARNEQTKKRKKLLDYQIQDYKLAQEKKHDPKLDVVIERMQEDSHAMEYKIKKFEERAA